MGSLLLVLVVVLVVAALVFGVVALLSGADPGLGAAEPDGRSIPLPTTRPLTESDLHDVRFDVGVRGYRMTQVDRALRRAAYDIGYKDEMVAVLAAEVAALREGRREDADLLRKAREASGDPVLRSGPPDASGGSSGISAVAGDSPGTEEVDRLGEPAAETGTAGSSTAETGTGVGNAARSTARA